MWIEGGRYIGLLKWAPPCSFPVQYLKLSQSFLSAFMNSFTHHAANEFQVTQYQEQDPENTKMSKIWSNLFL